jgi:hypothetical protein
MPVQLGTSSHVVLWVVAASMSSLNHGSIGCGVWVGGKLWETPTQTLPTIASLCAITPQHRLWFGSAFASCCGWADGNKAMVPRGGIEPSPIQLKVHHFSNDDVPVYLPVDPALSSRPGGCDSVPPYPSRARVTRYTKDIISAVCCAQMQIGTRP